MQNIGGKAKNLIKLKQLNYAVPEFTVLTADQITNFSNEPTKFDEFINNLEIFKSYQGNFAIRSSALEEDSKNKSYAGIFTSRIDVPRAKILATVLQVSQSIADAKLYSGRKSNKPIAVIIQKYIKAKFFGVCFTNLQNKLILNMYEGIGEDLVSGKVQGQEISISRETFTYLRKPKLILNYSRYVRTFLQIEKDFSMPQDIEFCIDQNNNFWILQTRPLTA